MKTWELVSLHRGETESSFLFIKNDLSVIKMEFISKKSKMYLDKKLSIFRYTPEELLSHVRRYYSDGVQNDRLVDVNLYNLLSIRFPETLL